MKESSLTSIFLLFRALGSSCFVEDEGPAGALDLGRSEKGPHSAKGLSSAFEGRGSGERIRPFRETWTLEVEEWASRARTGLRRLRASLAASIRVL